MFMIPKDIMCELENDFKKYLVVSYLIKDTNFKEEEYKGRKQFECTFSYSLILEKFKDASLSRGKLQTILSELLEDGYFEVVKKGTKGKPTILRNKISEQLIEEYKESKPKKKESRPKKESKPKEPKEPKEVNPDIEEIWSLYPNKKGKTDAVKKIEKLLKTYSKEELIRAVERYKTEKKGVDMKYIKNGSTFFNSGYTDYLDENYQQAINEKEETRKKLFDF